MDHFLTMPVMCKCCVKYQSTPNKSYTKVSFLWIYIWLGRLEHRTCSDVYG